MKKVIIGIVLLLTTALSAFSQTKNITVAGRVIEEDTKEPAVQATVQLLSLPDSALTTGIATTEQGYFTLPKVKAGKYVLKVSYIGFQPTLLPLQLSARVLNKNVGTLVLKTDAVMLAEAVITAEAPQVQVVEDTLQYNSSAYRTPEGAMLEELVKKLPGAEVDDDGNVKINGKDLKKIMVNGKEFFGGDVKTGLKNLPVEMIDKLKAYDKKSDLARITGIDDGEEETVLDLTVKKDMNQGVFGNFDLSGGTEDRYLGRGMVNYFRNNTQVSLIARANNVNDRGFSGGGGGPRWRRSNGLTASKELGLNFATESEKLELGGSARYNYNDNDNISRGYSENFLPGRIVFFLQFQLLGGSKSRSFNADFRLEWRPDTMTNIIFRPNVSYSETESYSRSQSGTFNADPLTKVDNPNDYLDLAQWVQSGIDSDDPLEDIRVNTSNNNSVSEGNSLSANATLQLNRRLNSKGRNLTFRGRFGYGDSDSESYNASDTWYFLDPDKENDKIRRYNTSPGTNYNYNMQLTYSEPIARATFLQFSYQFKYQYRENDKSVFDLSSLEWNLGDALPAGYEEHRDKDQSKYAEYKTYTHEATAGLRVIRPKYELNVGMNFQPQNTKLTYKKGETDTITTRNVFNFAPNVNFRVRFSKMTQLRFTYRGRNSQPSMEDLLPVVDDANPLNIRIGNPGLKPSFSHNMELRFNDYQAERQRSIFTFANFSATQNAVSSSRVYNEQTGGWTSTSKNINGNWNASGMFGLNTALKNKKFTIGSFSNVRYNNNVGYQTTGKGADAVEQKNTTTNLVLGERLNGAYRNDWLEVGLNGTFQYTVEKDKLNPDNNQEPYNFSYGANSTVYMPWNMSLSTNIANQSRRGYTDKSMNRNELIWNAQLSQTFLKGAATVSFEVYDILKQQSNISRTLNANGRSVYEYNGVNSYCMLHFIYRLNIFGGKAAREKMQGRPGFGPGGPGGPGGRPGGFGGRHRF